MKATGYNGRSLKDGNRSYVGCDRSHNEAQKGKRGIFRFGKQIEKMRQEWEDNGNVARRSEFFSFPVVTFAKKGSLIAVLT